jgi:hypothetical protein
MSTTYLYLVDPTISQFDPGVGLPNVVAGYSTPVDDPSVVAQITTAANNAGVAIIASPTLIGSILPAALPTGTDAIAALYSLYVAAGEAAVNSVPLPSQPGAAGQLYGTDGAGNTLTLDNEIAYAEYADGLSYALTSGVVAYFGCLAISVPVTPRSVTIEYQGYIKVTTAGAGEISCLLYETTGGTLTLLDSSYIGGTFPAGTYSTAQQIPAKKKNIGPTTTERQFAVAGFFLKDSGSALACSMFTGTAPPNPWYMKATA